MAAAQNNSLKTSTIKAKRTVVFCLFFLRKILQNFEIQTNCETEAAQIFGRKRSRSNIWKEKKNSYRVDIAVPGLSCEIQRK